MRSLVGRRAVLTGAATSVVAARARADSPSPAPAMIVPLFVRIVTVAGTPVAERSFVDEQLTVAAPIFAEHALAFVEAKARANVVARADVVTREDRDSFASLYEPGAINVFVVRHLQDVDEPGRTRMGVAWRCRQDLAKKVVIVAGYARPAVLAHELGHFLGNPHSKTKNNLMSYEHEEGAKIFLDAMQGSRARLTACELFASGALKRPLSSS